MPNIKKTAPKKSEPKKRSTKISSEVEKYRKIFSEFLSRNPYSEIEEFKKSDGSIAYRILKPWNDTSVSITIPSDYEDLSIALNTVLLPERLTAIWHADTLKLEVIWTALKLPASQKDIFGRKFSFLFKGADHNCSFDKSSEQLIEITKNTFPRGITTTNHRNIQSFYHYSNMSEKLKDSLAVEFPKSFWIDNIVWSEDHVVDIINNLNFYLTYYDDSSPTVVVHTPETPKNSPTRKTRYIHGAFPEKIVGRGLNDNLLSFWVAADAGNPVMRFILYYRIIEFASHHYIEDDVRHELRKMLSSPHVGANLSEIIERIIDVTSTRKLEDIPKFKSIVNGCVDPRLIWKEIQTNPNFFTKQTKFEGGFTVRSLIHTDDKEDAFCDKSLDGFCDLLRKIRNALSHGRDQETGGVISPTTRNFQLLQPWVHLIGTAAGEVVLYKDVS